MKKLTLGTNIAGLQSQRLFKKTSAELNDVFTRLSSGQRINSAADDPAGLALAESLNAKARINNVGIRNLNDGASLLNVVDSALESLMNITTRLEELATQASNGIYTQSQREVINTEAQALSDEFFRITQSTTFNNRKLLNGDFSDLNLQAGIGDNATLNLGVEGDIGTGQFSVLNSNSVSAANGDVQTADFNNDGIADLVTTETTNDKINILLGSGNGSFATAVSYQAGVGARRTTIGDFDGDGIFDLATANITDNTISVFIGNGNGTFQNQISYSTDTQPFAISSADINGDGYEDIATGNLGSSTLSVFLSNGDGTFATAVSYISFQPQEVELGDLNNDGIIDLISSQSLSNVALIRFGNGDGTFGNQSSHTVGADPNLIKIADVNEDGFANLIIGNNNTTGTISISLGNGDGTFQARTSFATQQSASAIAIADFNGDGHLDIANSEIANYIGISFGNGDGTFSNRISYNQGNGVTYLTSGDFNGNGVSDIAHLASSTSSVNIFENITTDGVAPLLAFDLTSIAKSKQALSQFQTRNENLRLHRGAIGAHLSRINIATNVLENTKENFEISAAKIREVDIAEETAKLLRLNILQQFQASMMAQANLQSELVLKLLS